MEKHIFFGRKAEIELLTDMWNSPRAAFLILYGRRRVGKTSLLTYWMKKTGHKTLFWVAVPTTSQEQLRSFSKTLYSFTHNGEPPPSSYTFGTWEAAWKELAVVAQNERLAVFIDEFTYLLESDPSIAGTLQNIWDHNLKNTNLFLALSGSHLGMMYREVLSYQAPLYGRATAKIHLQPLPFGLTKDYFPAYTSVDRVALYAIFGGIPAYWELVDPNVSISENIKKQLLVPNNLLQDEARLLLHDFVREPQNYIAILRAISQNARTQKAISGHSGLAQGHVSKYLSVLIEAGFVERRIPITARSQSRRGRYYITDPYLRFYYRFLATRQEQLAIRAHQRALDEIKRHLVDFIGMHTWEELCREWVLRAGDLGKLSFPPDQVGSVWTKTAQVDVVGINSMEKTLILGECKWQAQTTGRKVLTDLVAKTSEIVPNNGSWRVFYLGFSREGWTSAAHAFAEELNTTEQQNKNWSVAGMELLDLEQIDQDLSTWTVLNQ